MAKKISLFKRSNGMYYVRHRGTDGMDKWVPTGKRIKREALAAMQQGLEQEPTETHVDLAHLATLVYAYVTANHAPRCATTIRS